MLRLLVRAKWNRSANLGQVRFCDGTERRGVYDEELFVSFKIDFARVVPEVDVLYNHVCSLFLILCCPYYII